LRSKEDSSTRLPMHNSYQARTHKHYSEQQHPDMKKLPYNTRKDIKGSDKWFFQRFTSQKQTNMDLAQCFLQDKIHFAKKANGNKVI
jgi:hypothetical protein